MRKKIFPRYSESGIYSFSDLLMVQKYFNFITCVFKTLPWLIRTDSTLDLSHKVKTQYRDWSGHLLWPGRSSRGGRKTLIHPHSLKPKICFLAVVWFEDYFQTWRHSFNTMCSMLACMYICVLATMNKHGYMCMRGRVRT